MKEVFNEAVELTKSLFSDPLDTIYRAKNEQYFKATMLLAACGIILPFLSRLNRGIPHLYSLAMAILAFFVASFTLWKAGEIIKGQGTFGEMLQVCGLLWLPANIVWFACGYANWWRLIESILYITRLFSEPIYYFQAIISAFNMGIVANLLIWFCVYYVLVVVHRYGDFKTAKYALAEAVVLHWVAWSLSSRLLYWVAYLCHMVFSELGF